MTTSKHQEELLDEALEETFPASDATRPFEAHPSSVATSRRAGFRRLLMATDLSERCEEMVARGIEIARALDASIDLVHVRQSCSDLTLEGHSGGHPGVAFQSIDRALVETTQRIIDSGVSCQGTSLAGNPSREILAHARKTASDLILLGGHGHGGIVHALLGGVATRITKRAPCAVMVIPTPEHVERLAGPLVREHRAAGTVVGLGPGGITVQVERDDGALAEVTVSLGRIER